MRRLPNSRYEELKSLAADLIEDYALTYPLDPMAVAELLGIEVIIHRESLPEIARLCATTDAYTEPMMSRHGLRYRVHLNGSKPGLRIRFTLTHEIAHAWLDHIRADQSLTNDIAEAEANFLASYLLAPDALIGAWVPKPTAELIAATFQLSLEAAQIAQRRVMRAANLHSGAKHHDQRILSSATRRVEVPLSALAALLVSA